MSQSMPLFSRLIITLFGIAFAALFILASLIWLILYLVFASLRWLATGQKHQALLLWQPIQNIRRGIHRKAFSKKAWWKMWRCERFTKRATCRKTEALTVLEMACLQTSRRLKISIGPRQTTPKCSKFSCTDIFSPLRTVAQ